MRICYSVFLLTLLMMPAHADDAQRAASVKKQAEAMSEATMKGQYEKLIDAMPGGLVKVMGGREKAIQSVTTAMKRMKEQGVKIESYTVSKPGKFVSEGENTFVVVPTELKMTVPGARVITKSYLLGISADKGKTWKFIDGAGLGRQTEQIKKALPKFPEALKLPAPSRPKVIRD